MTPPLQDLTPLQKVLLGYLLLCLIGWGGLSLSCATGQSVAWVDHLFVAVSSVTTTGLTTINVADTYTLAGEITTLLLFQVGGMGFMSFTALLFHRLLYTTGSGSEGNMVSKDYSIPDGVSPRQFIRNIIYFSLASEAIGAIILSVFFWLEGETMPVWSGLYTAVSAFCTAGFSLFSDSLVDYRGHVAINLTIDVLSLLGSFGFLFFTDIFNLFRRSDHQLNLTSRLIILAMTVGLAFSFVAFFFLDTAHLELPGKERWLAALFQSVSLVSTTGFYSVSAAEFSIGVAVWAVLMMFIGASPSGTGGGIKNTTMLTVLAYVRSIIMNEDDDEVRLFGKQLPPKRVRTAIGVFLASSLMLAVGLTVLTFCLPARPVAVIFEAFSAFGTVGLSRGITSELPALGKLLLIVIMYCGRVGVLSVLIALLRPRGFSPSGDRKACESEEDVAVES